MPNEINGSKFYSINEIKNLIDLPNYEMYFEELDKISNILLYVEKLNIRDIHNNPYIITGIVLLTSEIIELNTCLDEINNKQSKGIKLDNQEQNLLRNYNRIAASSSIGNRGFRKAPSKELKYKKTLYNLYATKNTINKDKTISENIKFIIDNNITDFIFTPKTIFTPPTFSKTFNSGISKTSSISLMACPKNPHGIASDLIRYGSDDINIINKQLLGQSDFKNFTSVDNFKELKLSENNFDYQININNNNLKAPKLISTKYKIENNKDVQSRNKSDEDDSDNTPTQDTCSPIVITPSLTVTENDGDEMERIYYQVLKEADFKTLPVFIDGGNSKAESKKMIWDKMNSKNSTLFPLQNNINTSTKATNFFGGKNHKYGRVIEFRNLKRFNELSNTIKNQFGVIEIR